MPEDTPQIIAEQSKIRFPSHWKKPKYRLGQLMQQGQIVGIEYHPPGTKRSCIFGETWTYCLLLDDLDSEIEIFIEQNLQPLSPDELQEEIDNKKALIEIYQNNIAELTTVFEESKQS